MKAEFEKRFHRQKILPQIGTKGQEKIESAHVTIVGLGALGSVAFELLVRAGVKQFTVIDRDFVELTNLQRQSLYTEKDIGLLKTIAVKDHAIKINNEVNIQTHEVHLHSQNISEVIAKNTTIILDCTDNMETRFLINDFCHSNSIPFIYAAAVGITGSLSFIDPKISCLRCFMPKNAQGGTCIQNGVLNTTTHIIASMQVTKTIKYIVGEKINSNLEYYNSWNNSIRSISITKNEKCQTCTEDYPSLSQKSFNTSNFCSSNKIQLFGLKKDLQKLKEKFDVAKIESTYDGIILIVGPITLFSDGRAIIKAKTVEEAQTIYSKLIGN